MANCTAPGLPEGLIQNRVDPMEHMKTFDKTALSSNKLLSGKPGAVHISCEN